MDMDNAHSSNGTRPADTPARERQEGGDHYKRMGVEPWDVVDTWPVEQRIGFYRGNVLKYVMRLGTKDEVAQEARKARHYLDKLIEVLAEESAREKAEVEEIDTGWRVLYNGNASGTHQNGLQGPNGQGAVGL